MTTATTTRIPTSNTSNMPFLSQIYIPEIYDCFLLPSYSSFHDHTAVIYIFISFYPAVLQIYRCNISTTNKEHYALLIYTEFFMSIPSTSLYRTIQILVIGYQILLLTQNRHSTKQTHIIYLFLVFLIVLRVIIYLQYTGGQVYSRPWYL